MVARYKYEGIYIGESVPKFLSFFAIDILRWKNKFILLIYRKLREWNLHSELKDEMKTFSSYIFCEVEYWKVHVAVLIESRNHGAVMNNTKIKLNT